MFDKIQIMTHALEQKNKPNPISIHQASVLLCYVDYSKYIKVFLPWRH